MSYEAIVRYAGDDLFVGISPSGNAFAMDGNSDRKSAPTPLEHLLVAVAGCTAFDVQPILEKKRQDVTDYRVEITRRTARRNASGVCKVPHQPRCERTEHF